MTSVAVDPIVRDVEEAFVAHRSLLAQWPGARLVDEHGVLRFETPLRRLPYNGVLRTRIEQPAADVVALVRDAYARRGSHFFWVLHPSASPADLDETLEAAGLDPVETATGMSLDLDDWDSGEAEGPAGVDFAECRRRGGTAQVRGHRHHLLGAGRERSSEHVSRLNRYWSGEHARGRRWLAPPGVASIYGMSVRPQARGMGVAGGLTRVLVQQAQALGCRRVVLHSTDMRARRTASATACAGSSTTAGAVSSAGSCEPRTPMPGWTTSSDVRRSGTSTKIRPRRSGVFFDGWLERYRLRSRPSTYDRVLETRGHLDEFRGMPLNRTRARAVEDAVYSVAGRAPLTLRLMKQIVASAKERGGSRRVDPQN